MRGSLLTAPPFRRSHRLSFDSSLHHLLGLYGRLHLADSSAALLNSGHSCVFGCLRTQVVSLFLRRSTSFNLRVENDLPWV